ncbi:MAG: HPP family protein [archaeon]|nr:HPP family protein [archaeon]
MSEVVEEVEKPNVPGWREEVGPCLKSEFRWKPLVDVESGEATGCWPVHPPRYLGRLLGQTAVLQRLESRGAGHPLHSLFSGLCAFCGMIVVASFFLDFTDKVLLVASTGATSVLLYATPSSPLAQPRNVIFGNLIAAIVGVSMSYAFRGLPHLNWLAVGLSVGISISLMDATATLHPPAGATAVIPIVGSQDILDLGFLYVVYPVLVSESFLLIVALLLNNLVPYRAYPVYWL